jgi:acyl carrier protein
MTRQETLAKIGEILGDLTDQDNLQLTEETTAEQVKNWDSVNHVRLLLALEMELDVHFETDEVRDLKDVGSLLDIIEQKRG